MIKIKMLLILLISLYNIDFGYSQTNTKLYLAEFEFQNKNYEKAINYYTQCIQSEEDKYYAFYKRAFCYYELQNYKKAKADVKKAIKIPKHREEYNTIRGNGYWLYSLIVSYETNTPKALRLMKKSTKYQESTLLYSTLGLKEIDLGKYDDAIRSLNHSIQLDSLNAWAYSNRALAYLKKNELDLARNDIITSIRLDEKNPYVYKHSAMIYIALHDFESACKELHKAVELEYPNNMVKKGTKELNDLINKYCNTLESKED